MGGLKKFLHLDRAVTGAIMGPYTKNLNDRRTSNASQKKTAQQEANVAAGNRQAQQRALADEEAAYQGIPQTLLGKYTSAAQKAGTYSTTPEFTQGLNSEVEAGTRGARISSVERQNALRRTLGMTELGSDVTDAGTHGNQTQQALASGTGLPNPDPVGSVQPTPKPVAPATPINMQTTMAPMGLGGITNDQSNSQNAVTNPANMARKRAIQNSGMVQ